MKIALLDLNHSTLGVHTNTVPLGIGLIKRYIERQSNAHDIRLFKEAQKILKMLEKWIPDVVGITQYSWNSELNRYMARYISKLNPDCIVIAGGPNLYLRPKKKLEFLKEHPYIDICVEYDGEIPFSEIIKSLPLKKDTAIPGTYSIGSDGELSQSDESTPKISSLDVFGAVYEEGIFDELLDDGFHPFLQTQRGCPNRCTYCHTSDKYYSKIIFQSPEIFRKDMEYLGEKFSGRHDITLYLANPNFGLYNRDFEIADIIRDVQDKYDWPKHINCNYGSDTKKLLEIYSKWKYKMIPTVSLQTLTPEVLENINRKNISYEEFMRFQDEVIMNYGNETKTELILCLPGESKSSFMDTLSRVLNTNVQDIVIYTLMSLRGTPLATEESKLKYGQHIKYRLVPRCFSEVEGDKIFDIEEVVVATDTLSYDDYLYLRGISLVIEVFGSSPEFFPTRKKLIMDNKNVMEYIIECYNNISDNNTFKSFIKETKGELFDSKKELIDFYSKEKNFQLLLSGDLGDNLLRKYKKIMASE